MTAAFDALGLVGSEPVVQPAFSRSRIASTLTPKVQELIILPTEKCNFRCTYCYEDFAIGRMSQIVQRGIELFVEKRAPTLEVLNFSWFGGEPLLARDVVTRLARHAHQVSLDHGFQFKGGFTTNAYLLTSDLFEELLSYNQDFYQVTLDGWGSTHDEVRKLANGRPSFERIWANLIAMQQVAGEYEVLLRIHVRRDNLENLERLMTEIARQFGDDPRFRLDFEHLRDLGGEGGKSVVAPLSLRELKEVEVGLRRIYNAGRSGRQENIELQVALETAKQAGESAGAQRASDIAMGEPYICYAAKANSLLVRADGRIGKCTVALDDDRNTIGRLRADGTLDLDNAKLRPWLRGIESLDETDLGCPLATLNRYTALKRELETVTTPAMETV